MESFAMGDGSRRGEERMGRMVRQVSVVPGVEVPGPRAVEEVDRRIITARTAALVGPVAAEVPPGLEEHREEGRSGFSSWTPQSKRRTQRFEGVKEALVALAGLEVTVALGM